MQWPENVLSQSQPNFETLARQKRYRLLAQAAMRTEIRNLFLGHHQDDQIETILMRLIRGKSGSLASFWGIADTAPIPTDADIETELISSQDSEEEPLPHSIERWKPQRAIESYGRRLPEPLSINSLDGCISLAQRLDISLHRPLLKFSKARILATCKANDIKFVSDPTNFNPRLTLRNAVRYLLTNYKLPRALSRDSILKIHDRALDQLKYAHFEAEQALNVAELTSFDLRSGSLRLRVPKFPHLLKWQTSETPVSFLAQILRLVSPVDGFEMSKSSQHSAANVVFPRISPLHGGPLPGPVSTLAVNQVLLTWEEQGHHPEQEWYASWRLSRQPLRREQMRRLLQKFTYHPCPEDETAAEFYSGWVFWDCRYWIRICCTSIHYLRSCAIRPFQPSDAADLNTILDRKSKETLSRLLHDAAPGKVRYTLPVITDDVGIRAFPTLNFAVPEHLGRSIGNKEGKPELLRWKVKYKYIDLETIERLSVHGSSTGRYQAAAREYLKGKTRLV
jgi:tRNA(Ile)-lysidine synthase